MVTIDLFSDYSDGEYDFEARRLDPDNLSFNRPDPKAADTPWLSPYLYCAANPIMYIDPSGERVWPVDNPYKGQVPKFSDDFGKIRKGFKNPHSGTDINIGTGDFDLGAPVYSTHDGTVIRVASYKDGDSGGNRVKIQSKDGYVSTYYMHLNSIESDIKVGAEVSEGQLIGKIGGTGKGIINQWSPHLHYEMYVEGNRVDPVNPGNRNSLKDPQKMLELKQHGAIFLDLPEVVIQAPEPPKPPLRIIIIPPVVDATVLQQ